MNLVKGKIIFTILIVITSFRSHFHPKRLTPQASFGHQP